ncbi:hypothetical protein CHELA20_53399 [Hyphomicrobiales bacterium]|nr:hypothetical protein CHELA20_53399 [Hyphomicrobiales bacterium]
MVRELEAALEGALGDAMVEILAIVLAGFLPGHHQRFGSCVIVSSSREKPATAIVMR